MKANFMLSLAQKLMFLTNSKEMEDILSDYEEFTAQESPTESVGEVVQSLQEEYKFSKKPVLCYGFFSLFFFLYPHFLLNLTINQTLDENFFLLGLLLGVTLFFTTISITFQKKIRILSRYHVENTQDKQYKMQIFLLNLVVTVGAILLASLLLFPQLLPMEDVDYNIIHAVKELYFNGGIFATLLTFFFSFLLFLSNGTYYLLTLGGSYLTLLLMLFLKKESVFLQQEGLVQRLVIYVIVSAFLLIFTKSYFNKGDPNESTN